MKIFKKSFVFDFGSANTVVSQDGRIVFDEVTMISVWPDGYVDVGEEARRLRNGEKIGFWGKWAAGECTKTFYPISGGYVADGRSYEAYVKGVVGKLTKFPRFCSVVIAVPDDLAISSDNQIADSAFVDPFRGKGVKDVKAVHQSVAACAGLGLPSDKYHLLVDIGYGKTRASLVRGSAVIKTELWQNVSCTTWISDIRNYIRSQLNLNLGVVTAEMLLVKVAAACDEIDQAPEPCRVTGVSLMTAHPQSVELGHKELAKVIDPDLQFLEGELARFIKEDLMTLSEEVQRDIVSGGIWLIGGGSRLRGLSGRLEAKLGLPVHTTANPFHIIAEGAATV